MQKRVAHTPDASTNRTHWSAAETAQIAPYEGVAVSVVGFIVAVKKQSGGGDLVTEIAPDEVQREKLPVKNAANLYGWASGNRP